MQIEDFVKPYAEKLQVFKKAVFTLKHAHDFLQKLCDRGDLDKMESELTKCLLNTSSNRESEERKQFIVNFMDAYKKYSSENKLIKTNTNEDTGSKMGKEEKEVAMGFKKGPKGKEEFLIQRKFKVKNKEEEFPTLENIELVKRRKNYEVLDHHYGNKLEKGIKICFCMGSKHPLVGNCINCGRIQCLQEGDQECISCGTPIVRKDEYLKMCAEDKDMKKVYNHKEKLLKFQADFYSKLQIIDDFSDWYELANNTWIPKEQRAIAKKKDEDIVRIREDPEYEFSLNLKTLEVTKVYEQNDEVKMKDDITNFFIDNIRKNKEKPSGGNNTGNSTNSIVDCRAFTEKAVKELNSMIQQKAQKISYEENIKKLSKRIDLDTNEKIGDKLAEYNKNLLYNIELMTENDHFLTETDNGMCLSMHQPWASLLIEGFKRFEGRDWDSDFRGILWIHATSKKPEQDLIDMVEGECEELYKDCKNKPKFPKRYPTSCLLGCVDVVDVLKREVYLKLIHPNFREKTESKFLFVCKNPRKLEIPIKMPGQPNIYKLEESVLERTIGKLVRVNTFWWPGINLNVNLIDIPFNFMLKPQDSGTGTSSINFSKNKKTHQSNKLKITNIFEEYKNNSLLLVQHFFTRERKENILSLVEAEKKEMTYHNNYLVDPYIHIGLYREYAIDETPVILMDIYKELQSLFRDEKKIKMNLNLENVTVEYLDWYGCQNFRENKHKSIKVFIGNPIIMSILTDFSDVQGKSIRFECGDVTFVDKGILYAINQVMYDTVTARTVKMKQGVLVISFNCN